jgi:hypothetical protein
MQPTFCLHPVARRKEPEGFLYEQVFWKSWNGLQRYEFRNEQKGIKDG